MNGGTVIGATVLTGKPYSSVLEPTAQQLAALRAKHGQALEDWWRDRFGDGFDCLTQSEARTLSAPRMLTESEIALLRKSKQEIATRFKAGRRGR
ncbi:hypothetical protein [uncultured Thiocystis sp.]|jgi:hypothetical protein|uniref:hypothetical protein n=1 Tax=uncultured Thiocystis sp. TaxID=1202134 RepID=UPI0025DECA0D|nr:hypothetical protein [uncultured Thiocystis sp.]